ncbi:MAG TPA: 30S ribosome-binding factor RbfA [Cellvibrionales bacterium]|jgi:ribosome-binding factor A|nr:30S ribosome-binding factor RbfA [Pseudomonadales bacterium]HCH20807.1 30S ribosome-binding factor RbfA [Cellvibrionales bacterium]
MPKEYSRSERVADFIKREVALLLQRELRDPRVSNANVNAVIVSRDMSMAKIYVTFFDKETAEEAKQAVEVLNGAAGFIRSQVASQHSMRSTPKLRFYFDDSVRQGEHLSNLIDRAIAGNESDND